MWIPFVGLIVSYLVSLWSPLLSLSIVVLCLYGLVSGLLLRWGPGARDRPDHHSKRDPIASQKALRRIQIIAHRGVKRENHATGCEAEFVENTLVAFRFAVRCGVDMLELDVRLSRDKQVVVFHDKDFERLTDPTCKAHKWKVAETDYADFPRLMRHRTRSTSTAFTTESSVSPTIVVADDGDRVPLFKEVLQMLAVEFPTMCLIVELKAQGTDELDAELVAKTQDLLAEFGRLGENSEKREAQAGAEEPGTVWFSLNGSVNRRLQKAAPMVATINSVEEMLKVVLLFQLGLLPYLMCLCGPDRIVPAGIFGIPVDRVDYTRIRGTVDTMKAARWCPNCVIRALAYLVGGYPSSVLFNRDLNRYMAWRGKPVMLLGVNEQEILPKIDDMGVNAVLTDDPEWLCAVRSGEPETGCLFPALSPWPELGSPSNAKQE